MRPLPIRAAVSALFGLAAAAHAALPNGVAAGDVSADSAVLWARSDTTGELAFEWSRDPSFATLAGSFSTAVADPLQPVKAAASGLEAGKTYYYRATDAAGAVGTGTFRTAAAAGRRAGLRFGVSGDWQGELGPFPAVKNAAGRSLDFFVKLGDTIYAEDYSLPGTPTVDTLAGYRDRHDQALTERQGLNAWKSVRESTAVFATIDDHEVVNDFAGGAPVGGGQLYNQTQRYRDGLQAFREFMPIEVTDWAATGDARFDGRPDLYRERHFGRDAAVFVTDARSFRDASGATPAEWWDPSRTMLGRPQLDRLKSDLLAAEQAGTTWKFVMVPEPMQNLGPAAAGDRFEGYAAERAELLSFIHGAKIDNVVFVAADIHGTLVNNLTFQTNPVGPQVKTRAWEISTGPVAFDKPFGPTVVDLAASLGLLAPEQVAFYQSLPNAEYKDAFIKTLLDGVLADPYAGTALQGLVQYDPLGLEGSDIPFANLMPTDYAVKTHVYGWTEFAIDRKTQALTVSTFGVAPYDAAMLASGGPAIAALEPVLVSQFAVQAVPEPQTYALMAAGLAAVGFAARRRARSQRSTSN